MTQLRLAEVCSPHSRQCPPHSTVLASLLTDLTLGSSLDFHDGKTLFSLVLSRSSLKSPPCQGYQLMLDSLLQEE